MREVLPVENLSIDEYLSQIPKINLEFIKTIRQQKSAGTRPVPSTHLIDQSKLLTADIRKSLLDQVAKLVDENIYGRHEMCEQFADLLRLGLIHLGLPARGAVGTAVYYVGKSEVFRWKHAWIRIGDEVVDGNIDTLVENPFAPKFLRVAPYWGIITKTPNDRKLIENKSLVFPKNDIDVEKLWWPELRKWIDENL